ncbi:ATP-binding cassette subfamily B protein [Chitinophaga skermanii]|uniref:ATP-binding cassette subfamily B protein n=1 Tax=Chitinophaga skermanii TaxID=331697 RepID=A0A327R3D9_9BACT|nr:peptidase domain-containing ABC transporter [Chitinophaga skermanii]RAJ11171.1 ATP-binding cassette subfamily B protein [Chitinophaga skermanii]
MSFPFIRQIDKMDCGPVCLQMITLFYGKHIELRYLREICDMGKDGVSMLGIKNGANTLLLDALGFHITLEEIQEQQVFPIIVAWNQEHFVVVHDVKKRGRDYTVYVADPAKHKLKLSGDEFLQGWIGAHGGPTDKGFSMYIEPTDEFYSTKENDKKFPPQPKNKTFSKITKEIGPHKGLLIKVALGILVSLGIQVALPFITKSMVDYGINGESIQLIVLLLTIQFVFVLSKSIVYLFRNWAVLYIGSRINIRLISNYLFKMLRLPVVFFDRKNSGDIVQSINDNARIEDFLTTHSSEFIISIITLAVFEIILLVFSVKIFLFFLAVLLIYAAWVKYILNKRKNLDYQRFDCASKNQSFMIQLVNGVHDIKLSNAITKKITDWNQLQESLFHYNQKNLILKQIQDLGSFFLVELSCLVIVGYVAIGVVRGEHTLGELIALQYILAQLSAPVQSLVGFFKAYNETKLSLKRIAEVDEYPAENEEKVYSPGDLQHLNATIKVRNLSFAYPGSIQKKVLKDINVNIKKGKINAIVGTSGSGKTTFVKLLMKMYEPQEGSISVGNIELNDIDYDQWRTATGAVMQDGYIFSDSILNNIIMKGGEINQTLLQQSMDVANMQHYVRDLPNGLHTRIGLDGAGLSQGQKQRLLIARCIYKNPLFIFFDEATNSLDTINERIIYNNLANYYEGKTVIVVAHRLSTVKNADQIIVFHEGEAVETGTHDELIGLRGYYHSLVVNQLENPNLVEE